MDAMIRRILNALAELGTRAFVTCGGCFAFVLLAVLAALVGAP